MNKKVKEYKENLQSENKLEAKELQAGMLLPNSCQTIELMLFGIRFYIIDFLFANIKLIHCFSPMQAKVNGFKAAEEKSMKQTKAKTSNEKKIAEQKAAENPATPLVQAGKSASITAALGSASITAAQVPKIQKKKSPAPLTAADVHEVNLGYYQQVQEDARIVLKHLGSDFADRPALQIAAKSEDGKGGVQEPWSKEMAERAMGNQKLYIAAGNLFWLDFLKSTSPGVPLRRHTVTQLGEFLWPSAQDKPAFLIKLLECQAPTGNMPDVPSSLMMLSPEGYCHAALFAAARDLPKHKDEWEVVLRSVPMAFRELPSVDPWIYSWNLRNAIAQDYESLTRSAWQMAQEIAMLKKRLETDQGRSIQAAEMMQHVKSQGLKRASNQDELTSNLISMAVQVFDKFKGDMCVLPLLHLEEQYGSKSCLNSLVKLHVLVTKTTAQSRDFVVQGLYDWVIRSLIANDDITKTALTGNNNQAGLIALFELKKMCLDHWLSSMIARAKLDDGDRETLQKVLQSHDSYRKHMLGDSVSWQGALKRSSLDALAFLEAWVRHSKIIHCRCTELC